MCPRLAPIVERAVQLFLTPCNQSFAAPNILATDAELRGKKRIPQGQRAN